MVPLLLVSLVMWSLIVERLIFFRRMYLSPLTPPEILSFIKRGISPTGKGAQGIGGIFVSEFLKNMRNRGVADENLVNEVVLSLIHRLDRHLSLISTFASLAPLLGLLGTTIGMVKTFDVISVFGTGNARALASGISEALITTQTGLFIAIPGVYMSNFLQHRSVKLKKTLTTLGIFLSRELKDPGEM